MDLNFCNRLIRDLKKAVRYSPLATDLTAGEFNAQRTEAASDFH